MSALNNSLLLGQEGGGGYAISRSLRFNSSDSAYLSRTPASAGNRKTWTWAGWVKRSKLADYQRFFWATGECSIRFENDDTLRFSNYTGTFTAFFKTTAVYRDASAWYHIVLVADTTNATASDRIRLYVNGNRVTSFSSQTNPSQNLDLEINTTAAHNIGGAGGSEYFSGYLADIHFIDGQALDPTSFGEVSATTGVWMPKAYSGGSYGTNGFHLDFSNNASAAALGTDTSGNGNTWTVNNISVANSLKRYAENWTGANNAGYSWLAAFNGDENNGGAMAAYGSAYAETTLTLPASVTWSSSIRVKAILYTSGGGMIINGSDVTGSLTAGGGNNWNNLTGVLGSSGTLSTIKLFQQNTNYCILYAVELDGAILVDSVFNYNNDSLVDVPSSTGTDTGVGGEVRGNYCTLNPLEKGANVSLANGNLDISQSGAGLVTGTIGVSSGKWYWEFVGGTGNTVIGAVRSGSGYSVDNYVGANGTACGYAQNSGTGALLITGSITSTGSGLNNYTAGDVIGVALDLDNGTLKFYKNNTLQNNYASGLTGTWLPATGTNVSATTSSLNFGQRPFAYTAPSGFKALCTTNLPSPLVTKPSTVMDVKLYTGNGSTQTISGLDFSPDLVWIKDRSTAYHHWLTDSVRGTNKQLSSSQTIAETSYATLITALNSNGFSLSTDSAVNNNSDAYAAWCWDAGSSTVTDNTGSIQSTRRTNASAGFSIVSFVGASSGTIGHGLGVAPDMIILMNRGGTYNHLVYHSKRPDATPQSSMLYLNSTGVNGTGNTYPWNNTLPTSTVFSIGGGNYGQGSGNIICFCWTAVSGFSAFGNFTGTGVVNGPFCYTGFRPKWLLIRQTANATDWVIIDSARTGYNVDNNPLNANTTAAEATTDLVDLVSNGFKIRTTDASVNYTSGQYVWAAFAESPFQYARAR